MATVSQKIKLTLDECRMLVLGTQVMISLQFDLAFQSNFTSAPPLAQQLVPVGLALLLLAFALLLWGPAYHRISLDGRAVTQAQRFMMGTMLAALLPLSAALGVDAFIVLDTMYGRWAGALFGVGVFFFCAAAWYGVGLLARKSRPPEVIRAMKDPSKQAESSADLHDRVNQVMTEARVVLPGAQAMLGFQLITFFERAFADLPGYVKAVHLACAGLIALTVVLLMTPAAFHRIAEAGEDSHRLVRVAGRFVIGSMVPLALGMSGDFFVIVFKITGSRPLAISAGAVMLAVFLSLWFAYTLFWRDRSDKHGVARLSALASMGPPPVA